MKKMKNKTKSSKTDHNGSLKHSSTSPVRSLRDLFIEELKDIYWAEKALVKALPKMIQNATSSELENALSGHLEETRGQVTRLEKVFSLLSEKAVAKKCEATAGLIKEAEELMDESEKGAVLDAAIVSAGQKVEHYEIATYGTLCSFAKTLGEDKAASLLEETLTEEKTADEKLSDIATSSVNEEAAQLQEQEIEGEEE